MNASAFRPKENPKSFTVVIRPLSTRLIKPDYPVSLSHRCRTTVSLETRNLYVQCLWILISVIGKKLVF